MMHDFFLIAAIVLVFLMILSLVRVIGGPTILDRILGGNVIGTKTTVLLLFIGLLYEKLSMFVDIALAYALLNFIATLGATKFFLRRSEIHIDETTIEEKKL